MYTCTYSRECRKDNYMSQMERVAREKGGHNNWFVRMVLQHVGSYDGGNS